MGGERPETDLLRVIPPWRRRARGVQEEPGAPGEGITGRREALRETAATVAQSCYLLLHVLGQVTFRALASPLGKQRRGLNGLAYSIQAVGALVGVQAELPPRPASVSTQSRAWIWQVVPPLSTAIKSFALGCVVQTCKFAFDFPVRFHREDRCPIPALIKKAP